MDRNADELRPELVDLMIATTSQGIAQLFVDDARTTAPLWSTSVVKGFQTQMHALTATINAGMVHYIRCIRPNQAASPHEFDVALVEEQIAANGITQACRVMRNGYGHRMAHARFVVRFPRCTRRRYRSRLPSLGGFWGKTLVYMNEECMGSIRALNAALELQYAFRRHVRRRCAACELQRAARGLVARRHKRRRVRAAIALQRTVRSAQNATSNRYRRLDELNRLRLRIAKLTEELRQKDAWIFRVTLLLQRHVADARIASVLAGRPSTVA